MRNLRQHGSSEIYKKAFNIMDKYFPNRSKVSLTSDRIRGPQTKNLTVNCKGDESRETEDGGDQVRLEGFDGEPTRHLRKTQQPNQPDHRQQHPLVHRPHVLVWTCGNGLDTLSKRLAKNRFGLDAWEREALIRSASD